MKKLICNVLIFTLAISAVFSVPVVSNAEDAAPSTPVIYNIYDYYDDFINGVTSSSPWSLEMYTENGTITPNTYNTEGEYDYIHNNSYGYYPGFAFYNRTDKERYIAAVATPTNDGANQKNAAYVFTAPYTGSYTIGLTDRDHSAAFDVTDYFIPFNTEGEALSFGVRITVDGYTVWPETDNENYYEGYARFGSAEGIADRIAIPTISNIFLSKASVVKIEFTSFTPTAIHYHERLYGTVDITYNTYVTVADAEALSWGEIGIASDYSKPYEIDSGETVTAQALTIPVNSGIECSVTAENLTGGTDISFNGFKLVLDENIKVTAVTGQSKQKMLTPAANGKYDISFVLHNVTSAGVAIGTRATVIINSEEMNFDFPVVSTAEIGSLSISNKTTATITVTGSPIEFAQNYLSYFERSTNTVYVPQGTTLRAFKNYIADSTFIVYPDTLFTGDILSKSDSCEQFTVALEGDVNGDGLSNVRDLVRLKKGAAGAAELTSAQLRAAALGEANATNAAAAVKLRRYLLEDKVINTVSTLVYKAACENELSANLLTRGWSAYDKGYQTISSTDHNGNSAEVYRLQNTEQGRGSGMYMSLGALDIGTYVLSGYSRAEKVTRTEDVEYFSYALMLHLDFSDGTSKEFHTSYTYGTHDWEYQETSFVASKAVSNAVLYVLLRTPALGTADFESVSLVKGTASTVTFQDIPVTELEYENKEVNTNVYKTDDGLKMVLGDTTVTSVTVDGKELASDAPSGFLVRDITDDGVYSFASNGSGEHTVSGISESGFSIIADYSAKDSHIAVSGVIRDETNNPEGRAVQLSYALPITSSGWKWSTDILTDTDVEGSVYKSYGDGSLTIVDWDSEARSYYPTAALYNSELGLAIAVDMDYPTYWDIEYNAQTEQYIVTYHLGITPEAPDSARFGFTIYKLDSPEWGFRSAMQKYTEIHPDYYEVRETEQGLWLAWADTSGVENPEDFNIKFKEIDHDYRNTGEYEVANGIKGYYYIEAGDWWISNLESDTEAAIWEKIAELSQGDISQRAVRQALATYTCKSLDPFGMLNCNFVNNAWCPNGAQIHINANPALPGQYNFYNLWYNNSLKKKLFVESYMTGTATFDGIYLDELSGWWVGNANFNTEHYNYTTVPLTYSPYYKQPMLHRASTTWEFVKKISDDLHSMNKTVFANKCPERNAFYTPLVDVMGTENTALSGTTYSPQSIEQLSTWRTLAYQKPFCILLSNNYDVFDHEMMEKYFNRCLAYGIFPSPSGSYSDGAQYFTSENKYYERDRDIFQKYMPTLKAVAEAGWNAVTAAYANNSNIILESFGTKTDDGYQYYTVYNPTDSDITVTVTLQSSAEGLAYEMISGTNLSFNGTQITLTVAAQHTSVVRIG